MEQEPISIIKEELYLYIWGHGYLDPSGTSTSTLDSGFFSIASFDKHSIVDPFAAIPSNPKTALHLLCFMLSIPC